MDGRGLRLLRLDARWNQQRLAAALGIPLAKYRRYELALDPIPRALVNRVCSLLAEPAPVLTPPAVSLDSIPEFQSLYDLLFSGRTDD
jgi:transcriptional regulator with XRE-family HTH domain